MSTFYSSTTLEYGEKPRVLIVDDTPDSVWVLAGALKNFCTIQVASSGEIALETLARTPLPEIVLLDVQMPGIDGFEVCRRIKAEQRTQGIPIIFITSTIDPMDESKGLKLGASDYIHKPFSPDIVRARVMNTVEIKRYKDNLHSLVQMKTSILYKTQQSTILALADVAEWRDPDTGEHIKRTQNYVNCIARVLAKNPKYVSELTPQAIELMCMCAPLHDVGKVSIPDAILLKPGKLDNPEFSLMQKHSEFGAEILQKALNRVGNDPFLELAYEVARWHHECWDGSGYPDGLKGEAIPIAARIMSVADVYDALISPRPYKQAFTHEKTVQIITAEKNRRFDPMVVDAFLECHEEIRAISQSEIAIAYAPGS